jgi:hypothetical protein
MSSSSDSAAATSPRRSRSSTSRGQHRGERECVADHAGELGVELSLAQQPDGADQFAAQQDPVGRDGPLELLCAL